MIKLFHYFSFLTGKAFVRTAIGPTNIRCNENSIVVTNTTEYRYWQTYNEEQSCLIGPYNISYVCLKSKYVTLPSPNSTSSSAMCISRFLGMDEGRQNGHFFNWVQFLNRKRIFTNKYVKQKTNFKHQKQESKMSSDI